MTDLSCHNKFCQELKICTRNRLCKACLRLQLKPKQEIVFERESNQVAIINSGVIISIFLTNDGKQKSLELLKIGSLLGTENLFNNKGEQNSYMQALTLVNLCLFPVKVFESFFQQNPDFAKAVLHATNHRLQKNLKRFLHMQISSSEEKVRFILEFLKEAKIDHSLLTHEDIALLADLNRVTVTRALKNIYQLNM